MCTCLLGHGLPTTKACPPSPTPAPASCQPTAVPREATGHCGLRAARSGSPLVSVSAALGTSNSSLCGTMGSSSAPSSAAYTGAISARYCSSSNIRQMSSSGTLLTSASAAKDSRKSLSRSSRSPMASSFINLSGCDSSEFLPLAGGSGHAAQPERCL